MGNAHTYSSRPVGLHKLRNPPHSRYSHSDAIQDSSSQSPVYTEKKTNLGECQEDTSSQTPFYTEGIMANHCNYKEGRPSQSTFYTDSSITSLGDYENDRPSQSTFYTEDAKGLGVIGDCQEDRPKQSTFYTDIATSLADSGSGSGSLSDDSWVSAVSTLDADPDNTKEPDGDLTHLFRYAGEEDQFLQAVLSFCSHMDGRLESLDNAHIYEEFRSYTDTGHDCVVVAH